MKELANLSRIVTSRRLPKAPLLELDSHSSTKENQLVAKLLKSPGLTQSQLVRDLYGETNAANNDAFRKLRSRVQTKLLNHLYFLDHTDARYVVARRYEMELLEMYHQASALLAEGEYVLAERRLRKSLRLAQEGEFTQYAVLTARLLCNLYVHQRQALRYRNTAKLLEQVRQQLAWEDEAELVYRQVRIALTGTVAARRALLPKLPEYITQLESLHRRARTFSTFHFVYRLRLAYEELQGNYAALIRITTAADRQLQQGKLNVRRFDKRYNQFTTIYAYLQSRQPVRGLKLAEQYILDFHPSSNNWFYFQEHHLLLALHAGQYSYAQRLLLLVREKPFYAKQQMAAQQRWDLFRAYIEFLLPPPGRQLVLAQWALALPDFSRDKRGHNVAILILQVLYYLRLRQLDAVVIRLERLRKYQQRHLRDAETLRSRLFVRLLLMLVEKDFNPTACAESAKTLLKKLQEAPMPGEAYAELEVVPYENLWALTLDILRTGAPLSALASQ